MVSSGWSPIRVVCHQDGLSSGWSPIRSISHQGGLSSEWSLIRVVCHQGHHCVTFSEVTDHFSSVNCYAQMCIWHVKWMLHMPNLQPGQYSEIHKILIVCISYHRYASKLWSCVTSSLKKICTKVDCIVGNGSLDVLVVWALFSCEVLNSRITWHTTINRMLCVLSFIAFVMTLWKFLVTPWKKGDKVSTLTLT